MDCKGDGVPKTRPLKYKQMPYQIKRKIGETKMDRNVINKTVNQSSPNKARLGTAPRPRTNQPSQPSPQPEPFWKVAYNYWHKPKFQFFTDKLKAIEFVNSLQNYFCYSNITISRCYL